jgi:O-antigen/teichoic acid export membrane protein
VFSSLDDVGIYALGYKIGMIGTMLLMEPFQKIWAPFLFENYQKDDGEMIVGRVFTIFTFITLFFCLFISVVSPIVIPLISDNAYHSSYNLIPLICIASVFYGMACIADAGILISKKTKIKPFLFGIASLVSVVLNLLLIPPLGVNGAAISLAITFFILLIITYRASSRYFAFKIEKTKLLIIFVAAILTYLLSHFLFNRAYEIASVVCFFIYPLGLWAFGFFSASTSDGKDSLLGRINLHFKKP